MSDLTSSQLDALKQLVKILSANQIKFVVIGGLAAIAWGSRRPLADIDILVDGQDLSKLQELLKNQVTTPIQHYRTQDWDIWQLVIELNGIGVDICDADNFYVINSGEKHQLGSYVDAPESRSVDGVRLPVIPKPELISYKRLLNRAVDQEDLLQLASEEI